MDKWDRFTGFFCETCMSFAPKNNIIDSGRCRFNAPTMQGYPVVYAKEDWCGRHKIGTNPSKNKDENK